MGTEEKGAEIEIRTLVEERVRAIRAKDVAGACAHVAPNVVAFDVINPLRNSGLDALEERVEQWFSSFEGPIGFEVRDLSVVTSSDVAFSYSLNGVNATMTNGNKLQMWWRSTIGYRRIDGEWTITHEHNSVPFDPQTGKASVDLKP